MDGQNYDSKDHASMNGISLNFRHRCICIRRCAD